MLLVGREHAVNHGLDRGLDRHKGRAQLVRDVGGKTTFKLVALLDVVGHGVEGLTQTGDLVVAG